MLKFYNTLSRKIEAFKPRRGKKVNIFVCGPTVYDFSHLGHARTYLFFDILANYLKFLGYKVFYLQNITDIDDKILQRAKEKNVSWQKLAENFTKEYFQDMAALKINSVSQYAPATKHIKEIISQTQRLLKRGFAYQANDGIYYDIAKFKGYGRLSKRTILAAEDAVSRIDEAVNKKNKGDFCLWKLALSDSEGSPSWQSPWGPGRPGWHIEDTAITEKYFGPQYDVHGGARDLIFPHHEAEIAQMEAISGKKPLVKYWLHTGFLTVKGQKMAKSLGNFITIRNFLENNSPEVLRFFIFSSHYRSPVDFQEKTLKEVKTNLKKLRDFLISLKTIRGGKKGGLKEIKSFEKKFWQTLEEDFNTPRAKALLFDFINKTTEQIEAGNLLQNQAKEIERFFEKINRIFQFLNLEKISQKRKIPAGILLLVKEREKARKQRDWKKADEIRKKVEVLGYKIEDTAKGPKLKRI